MPVKEMDTMMGIACTVSHGAAPPAPGYVVSDGETRSTKGGSDVTATDECARVGGRALIHPQRHNLKNRFQLIRTLGEGTYGKVKLAFEKSTGEQVAIKYVKKTKIQGETDLNRIRREIRILTRLRHQNIVNIRQVFEKKDRIVLVMDCAQGGELYDYLNNHRNLPEAEIRRIFRQIVSAVHYIHQNGIVHRDLKLENIILDSEGNVKVADFGLANYFSNGDLLTTFCGSPLYASPEIVNGRPYQGPEVDVWSVGVVLYTLAYGAMPFESSNLRVLREQISHGAYATPSHPSGAAGLIRHMLTVSPSRRATMSDILNHWWVNLGHEYTPDGRKCEPASFTIGRASHRQHGPVSARKNSDPKSSLSGHLQVPDAKSAETSFDEDEMLYDMGTPVSSTSSTPALSSNLVRDSSADDLTRRSPVEPGNSVNWSQALANSIQEIKDRIVNSLATDEVISVVKEERTEFRSKKLPHTDVQLHRSSNTDHIGTTSFSKECVSDHAIEKSTNVFDSDRKPARSILKRKGKFSGGDSGCCIMVDDASLKAEEDISDDLSSMLAGPSDIEFNSRTCPDLQLPTVNLDSTHRKQSPPISSMRGLQMTPCQVQHSQSEISSGIGKIHQHTTAGHSQSVHEEIVPTRTHQRLQQLSSNEKHLSMSSRYLNNRHIRAVVPHARSTNDVINVDVRAALPKRKGILKNVGSYNGARDGGRDSGKRSSIGSASSNSSEDVLDLSYDSNDSDQLIGRRLEASYAKNPDNLKKSVAAVEATRRKSSFSLEGEFTAITLGELIGGLGNPVSIPPCEEMCTRFETRRVIGQAPQLAN